LRRHEIDRREHKDNRGHRRAAKPQECVCHC
jgi:hypothetical protein